MLAGHPPFNSSGLPYSAMRRISDPIPSLRVMRPEVPAGVQLALERALAFDPESRCSSIAEFARSLETGATAGTPAVPQPAGPAKRRTAMWAIGVVVLSLIGVLGGVLFNRRAAPSDKAATAATGKQRSDALFVLPFENQGDAGDAYFADGMAEDAMLVGRIDAHVELGAARLAK